MSFESDLTVGVGVLLSTSGVGVWGSTFAPTDTAIVFGELPPTPDQGIGLTPYPLRDEGNTGLAVVGVQVYLRAMTLPGVMDLRDAVRSVLHNRRDYVVGGASVSRSWRQMAAPQGSDANYRRQLADSYYFLTGRQVLH